MIITPKNRRSSLLFPIPDSRFPIPDSRFPIPCFLYVYISNENAI
ncbi:hypothetical protein BJP36_39925 [Moorena producens JHB]|uniref:Uncharacterized protein n=2 Tax=Coleofasciculaceae TaxID=1892251 RepID=A0A9Q9SS01_MOOP1|nr:hypothetical protein [Moorena producens]WAN68546.1 hypothetical protein BJP36_39925 [Moorena producens JHB]